MDLGLKGRKAAISGGSDGLGFAIAMGLAGEGCDVAISARGAEQIAKAVDAIGSDGVKAIGVQCDMSSAEGCQTFIDRAVEGLGGLDILVNCVGGMTPGTLDSLTGEQWEEIINRNQMAYVHTTRAAVPHLEKSDAGRILNLSGISGKQLMPGSYSTALPNAAINALTKLTAGDLAAKGITVNNLCPGLVDTPRWGPRREAMAKVRNLTAEDIRGQFAGNTLLGRWGKPGEIADVATFLLSPRNSYMTGSTVEVCGGWGKYF